VWAVGPVLFGYLNSKLYIDLSMFYYVEMGRALLIILHWDWQRVIAAFNKTLLQKYKVEVICDQICSIVEMLF
jgi:hypothetical protein